VLTAPPPSLPSDLLARPATHTGIIVYLELRNFRQKERPV
jgi:hypothetical protein